MAAVSVGRFADVNIEAQQLQLPARTRARRDRERARELREDAVALLDELADLAPRDARVRYAFRILTGRVAVPEVQGPQSIAECRRAAVAALSAVVRLDPTDGTAGWCRQLLTGRTPAAHTPGPRGHVKRNLAMLGAWMSGTPYSVLAREHGMTIGAASRIVRRERARHEPGGAPAPRPRTTPPTPREVDIWERHAAGTTLSDLAAAYGISKTRAFDLVKRERARRATILDLASR